MMLYSPDKTASSASAHTQSSAFSIAATPPSAGYVMSIVTDEKLLSLTCPIERMRSRSLLVRIGCSTSSRLCLDVPSRSRMFGRGPMNDTRLMTSSSRIESIGGFVTWAKFCLK